MDIYSSWFYEIKDKLHDIIEKEQIACVLTTSPPHSTHLFGRYLKKTFSVPWIMDLRDPMVNWPGSTGLLNFLIQNFIAPRFERQFYRSADFVVFVTKFTQRQAHKRCQDFLTEKSTVIRNGYDPDDFSDADIPLNTKQNHKFCITYTGTILTYQNPKPFCDALISLTQKKLLSGKDIKLLLVGKIIPAKLKIFKNLPEEIQVRCMGPVSHKQAIGYQMAADILLLFMSEDYRGIGKEVLPGKVFEYIGSGKPVFVLAKKGELSELIQENQFGYVADPGKQEEVEMALLTAYNNWKKGIDVVAKENRTAFTRESQCKAFSQLINNIA